MDFEWDENKREKTLLERGIDFIDAALIWDDPKSGLHSKIRTSVYNVL